MSSNNFSSIATPISIGPSSVQSTSIPIPTFGPSSYPIPSHSVAIISNPSVPKILPIPTPFIAPLPVYPPIGLIAPPQIAPVIPPFFPIIPIPPPYSFPGQQFQQAGQNDSKNKGLFYSFIDWKLI
jgi:hypothetical protein